MVAPLEEPGLRRKLSPTERRRAILEHVLRYRLTTGVVLKTLFFAHQTPAALTGFLKEWAAPWHASWTPEEAERERERFPLCAEPFHLTEASRYYRLTKYGAKQLGIKRYERIAKAQDVQSLYQKFPVLAYCCQFAPEWELLTHDEFKDNFSQFSGAGTQRFALDQRNTRMTRFVVDTGKSRSALASKCHKQCNKFERNQAFRDLRDSGRFHLTVLTGYPESIPATKTELGNPLFPVKFAVVPTLAELIETHD